MKILAVRYKDGEFGDGVWSVREKEESGGEIKRFEYGLRVSPKKFWFEMSAVVGDPQLRR